MFKLTSNSPKLTDKNSKKFDVSLKTYHSFCQSIKRMYNVIIKKGDTINGCRNAYNMG